MASSQTPLKRRSEKQNQEFIKTRVKNEYSLDTVSDNNWQLFMWFASLETVENYICLFILVWDIIPVRNSAQFSKELREETDNLIQIIKELNISKENDNNYSKMLDDYKGYRFLSSQTFRQNLVHNVWKELENHGLKNNSYAVSEQLSRCSLFQKKELRAMILSRIKSFQSFSRKIKEAKELQQVPLNNKMKDENQELILSENKSLENQIVGLADNKSQIGNSVSLEDESRDTQELKKRENENLKTQVKELIKENSKQQAALDNLTNVFWNDDESHNSKKLIQDITDLQDMLTDFTMVQGSDYKINNNEANSLLRAFKCEVNCPSSRASLVLGFLLQRITIAKIIEEVEKYLNGFSKNQEMTLERDIVNTTETLINQIILFEKNLKGEDDTTKITPIKIRQNVYSALSHRGFPSDHSLIKSTASKLLYKMNKYRKIVDEETKSEMDDQAIQITHKVINIFYFSFKTQASVPTYKFFDAGQALEPHLMKGAFGNDESKKLEVEICGFPCIGIFTGDKLSDRIFIKAQIIPRSKRLS
ncbi:uncharacterized protein OCT59_004844 [Rhizophagus irregularis]|uniref:Uncharacterized protein n=2 Tax=Rhizophagus irregularis TaxID=588596 RepID=U9UPK5_RHIID|nr:hypothetical protein GLOIN_2v1704967 [Rhizophagus irregularis DAOM 181602=DAOM 197198]EXX65251.1 hypothetical protein RirG_135060 [Rhizophagus irregularis DAOM 197198w]POG61290.1 hypothetical protein GLOIN_2v1704967 [Rhizophagus irregularis DAOM 181602=DAOM 197198]UZO13344.1 hypothetical protein OCT59_004844 [Rhizophagus irregularis]GBC21793.1 hypothetical protein GLOIN_2v1704967 [Rhizophagus irregularis DAOM 181602=DAOM 197198]|eukprot:XP_025168156.1 hypothetical protein GLOIN_2v1704967 [Rhizophagus irregularis DAOM 181602=DAOM 197198]